MIWLRYSLVFLAVAIGVAQIVRLLNATTDSGLGSSAQLMVPAMIAALIEGQQFARQGRRSPRSREAWTFALAATLFAIGLNLALAYLGPTLVPEFALLAIAPAASKQFLILLGLYGAGYLICNRFFFGIGAGNQLSLMRSRDDND